MRYRKLLLRLVGLGLVVAAIGGVAIYISNATAGAKTAATLEVSPELIERGEYLVAVSWLGIAMRGCAWGGSARNNWVVDTMVTWITSIAWMFVGRDLDGKVRAYGKKNGHPSTYAKV